MSALQTHLEALIRQNGPMDVAAFMTLALGHYYSTRDPFGKDGDFTTAPEVSQMFGELIGLWLAERWIAGGRPAPFALAELGPGRGTLMADALRAMRTVPGMVEAASVHFVETSPALREAQRLRVLVRHQQHRLKRAVLALPAVEQRVSPKDFPRGGIREGGIGHLHPVAESFEGGVRARNISGIGTALGGWISDMFIPYLQVGASPESQVPPYVVYVAWPAILRVYLLFGLLFIVALIALVILLRRMKIFQAIKMGETV